MILGNQAILDEIEQGNIKITPFNEDHVGPCSYDITLHEEYKLVYANFPPSPLTAKSDIIEFIPGVQYLCCSQERIYTSEKIVANMSGRSSIGRKFVSVHHTAGFGDPGWDGVLTFEITVESITEIEVGTRIAQLQFHRVDNCTKPYNGRYQNATQAEQSRL